LSRRHRARPGQRPLRHQGRPAHRQPARPSLDTAAMKIGRVFPDLLRGLGTAASVEDGLRLTLRRLVRLTGADGGALRFQPPRGRALTVVATGPGGPALEPALRALVPAPPEGARNGARKSPAP